MHRLSGFSLSRQCAHCTAQTGEEMRGFGLLETVLVVTGVALLAGAALLSHRSSSAEEQVRTERAQLAVLVKNAARVYTGPFLYAPLTTSRALANNVVPGPMVRGSHIISVWDTQLVLAPVTVAGREHAGLEVTYTSVPASSCQLFATSMAFGTYAIKVDKIPVKQVGNAHEKLDEAAIERECADGAEVAFTFYQGGASAVTAR